MRKGRRQSRLVITLLHLLRGRQINHLPDRVIGDVKAGGRGYFYVSVPAPATTCHATVQSFDKVAVEAPQAP